MFRPSIDYDSKQPVAGILALLFCSNIAQAPRVSSVTYAHGVGTLDCGVWLVFFQASYITP